MSGVGRRKMEEVFSVNSCYKLLVRLFFIDDNIPEGEERVFGYIWKCQALSKVLVFAWTMLLDRIPTKVNLAARGVLNRETSKNCVLCGRVEETTSHLFLHCEVVMKVLRRVMSWFQFNFSIPHNLFAHFECWYYEVTHQEKLDGDFV